MWWNVTMEGKSFEISAAKNIFLDFCFSLTFLLPTWITMAWHVRRKNIQVVYVREVKVLRVLFISSGNFCLLLKAQWKRDRKFWEIWKNYRKCSVLKKFRKLGKVSWKLLKFHVKNFPSQSPRTPLCLFLRKLLKKPLSFENSSWNGNFENVKFLKKFWGLNKIWNPLKFQIFQNFIFFKKKIQNLSDRAQFQKNLEMIKVSLKAS